VVGGDPLLSLSPIYACSLAAARRPSLLVKVFFFFFFFFLFNVNAITIT